jgi:hypothetical protein
VANGNDRAVDERDIYARLSHVERDVTALAAKFATFSEDIERRLSENTASIKGALADLQVDVRAARQPVSWVPLGVLLISTLVAGGTYVETRIRPLEELNEMSSSRIAGMELREGDRREAMGYLRGWQEANVARLRELEGWQSMMNAEAQQRLHGDGR